MVLFDKGHELVLPLGQGGNGLLLSLASAEHQSEKAGILNDVFCGAALVNDDVTFRELEVVVRFLADDVLIAAIQAVAGICRVECCVEVFLSVASGKVNLDVTP